MTAGSVQGRREFHVKHLAIIPLLLVAPVLLAWEKDCPSTQCRIYTYTDVSQSGSSEPVRMFLEITASNNVILTALNTRTYHARFYTTKPATHVRLNQKDYVPVRNQFSERSSGTLTIDGRQIAALLVRNESQLKNKAADFDAIAQAFKLGTSATIDYTTSFYGKGQVSFSLMGFTEAYGSLSPIMPPSGRAAAKETDPISVLDPLLAGNRFSVRARDLALKKNPHGAGVFVYATKTRYSGVERLFLWFVRGDTALKLNGATHNLTPSLPFPRDASLDFWDDTGLSSKNATKIGLELAFER